MVTVTTMTSVDLAVVGEVQRLFLCHLSAAAAASVAVRMKLCHENVPTTMTKKKDRFCCDFDVVSISFLLRVLVRVLRMYENSKYVLIISVRVSYQCTYMHIEGWIDYCYM